MKDETNVWSWVFYEPFYALQARCFNWGWRLCFIYIYIYIYIYIVLYLAASYYLSMFG